MIQMSRFDRKVAIARTLQTSGRDALRDRAHAETQNDPLKAYDLALLAAHEVPGEQTPDPVFERAETLRRQIGVAVLVSLICALAILAAIAGPEPVHPALFPGP
ncbi:MAG: hypothetical protein EKK41_19835 [Hyphomicrobiales bacterium]|jgi:hypothetical protein|nr:MAG: hypothetical protein EKK41_19835 [Hyphomicrobiales bacterium]